MAGIHLEIQSHRKNPYGVLRSSYRNEDGKVVHKSQGRINGLSMEQLKLIQASFQGKVVMKEQFKILQSKEYGASWACLQIAKDTGLDKVIYSKNYEQWVKDALVMITGRIVYAGSKLYLSNMHGVSAIWELAGHTEAEINVNTHCYEVMDKLYERKESIEKKLAKKHLDESTLVLYDITSSYLEGEYENSELVAYGYNRDKKRGKEQVVIGLLCNSCGCPVAVEVFKGNTKDSTTVMGKIKEIKELYKINDIIFVGDRGMITKSNFEKINEENEFGEKCNFLKTISALTHSDIRKLCERDAIQISLFDEKNVVEVEDPEAPEIRYGLCKNPVIAKEEHETRKLLLDKTIENLEKIASSPRKNKKEDLGIRAGKILNKYKMGKFIKITKIDDKKLEWIVDEEKIRKEEALDGCYVIYTNASKAELSISDAVKNYKSLIEVEQAFRSMKTVALEIRPIYHRTDDRIKAHIFICMLAYYIMWHMKSRLEPLFLANAKGSKSKYTFDYVIELLKSIRSDKARFGDVETSFITEATPEQEMILNLLGI